MTSLEVENLGKRYRLGRGKIRLSDVLMPASRQPENYLWALRGVSFSVGQGQALGVIGPNGAGKTTLLRILSRVTAPTEGRAVTYGRVFSLLELGAGMQPDETGRENIRILSAFYGISGGQVNELAREIGSFAELEKFIDTPVRHYSSGMYLRLAFSIAMHIRPDILLADEVLAVGDAGFQRRCLDRLQAVGADGAAIVVVSHDLGMIRRLCPRVLWLDKGRVEAIGPAEEILERYHRAVIEQESVSGGKVKRAPAQPGAKPTAVQNSAYGILSLSLMSHDRRSLGAVKKGEVFFIKIILHFFVPGVRFGCVVDLYSGPTLVFRSGMPDRPLVDREGPYEVFVKIPANLLADREYQVHFHSRAEREGEHFSLVWPCALTFRVYQGEGDSMANGFVKHNRHAVVSPKLEWVFERKS